MLLWPSMPTTTDDIVGGTDEKTMQLSCRRVFGRFSFWIVAVGVIDHPKETSHCPARIDFLGQNPYTYPNHYLTCRLQHLYGGESGIRNVSPFAGSASYRLHVANVARFAMFPGAPCTMLHHASNRPINSHHEFVFVWSPNYSDDASSWRMLSDDIGDRLMVALAATITDIRQWSGIVR